MKKILLRVIFLLSLMVCLTSPGWAGGLDDLKAGQDKYTDAIVGQALGLGSNYGEAITLFTKAIESGELSRENLSIAYRNRGYACEKRGDKELGGSHGSAD